MKLTAKINPIGEKNESITNMMALFLFLAILDSQSPKSAKKL